MSKRRLYTDSLISSPATVRFLFSFFPLELESFFWDLRDEMLSCSFVTGPVSDAPLMRLVRISTVRVFVLVLVLPSHASYKTVAVGRLRSNPFAPDAESLLMSLFWYVKKIRSTHEVTKKPPKALIMSVSKIQSSQHTPPQSPHFLAALTLDHRFR